KTDLLIGRSFLIPGVQAAYWGMLDEGRITQITANILMKSVEEAIDSASHGPLCDWKGLKANVHFPSYYRFLQSGVWPRRLVTYFIVGRLESACYICAAFLRAHRIARRKLHDFIGDSEIASTVISESKAEGEEAREFLEDVRVTFPEVLRVVKTRQVTYSVLNHLIDYVQHLEMAGLLEEKEMLHLQDAVQTDLKRLLRNPPLVKIPKLTDLISTHPVLGALPSTVREPLEGSTKGTMKPRGVALYKEGSKPNGVWLISNGVVKWGGNHIRNKHSLHPTFTHGSTLGIYEVLVEKPYICDMITDSVVLCFFVESDKILSAARSDPAVEDFLWKESAIVLAKVLLPQIFEKMAMQDLRALVSDRSMMGTHIRGETIELPHHSIGFLLEGYVKSHGLHGELITSPAALLPSHGNLSFGHANGNQSIQSEELTGSKSASFSHQRSWYQVETRSRVIIFDMAAFEADTAMRRISSFVPHTGEHLHRPPSKEHELMSWPDSFYKAKSQKDLENRQPNSLSARAMQLSIFGSMVDMQWRTRASSSHLVQRSQSMSFPRATSFKSHILVSVKSEGSTTVRKNLGIKRPKSASNVPIPLQQNTDRNESHALDDSSDESGPEDDHIIRIDSPSRLSFRQAT
ncbi:sodium/hydrogen exchanger 7, partial [Jatropha curcas]|uniref:sodium/hydrogen exchanger 7 n=1 Tax=Jatropha curcas TaxID=180498 RepID=UPI001894B4F9